jgi:hypothetical protein
MGEVRSAQGGDEKYGQNFGWKSRRKETIRRLGVDVSNIKMDLREIRLEV